MNSRRVILVGTGIIITLFFAGALRRPGPAYGGKPASFWVRELGQEDFSQRNRAEHALQSIGAAAVPRLIKAVQTRDAAARRLLGAIEPRLPSGIRRLIPAHADAARIREATAHALGVIGPPARAAIGALRAALDDPEPRVRGNAAFALGRIGPEAREAAFALSKMLDEPREFLAVGAANALGRIGDRAAVAPLARKLNDRRTLVRESAALALGKIGPAAAGAVANLVLTLNDPEPGVRRTAASALGKIGAGARAAVPALIAALKDEQIYVRICAAEALGEFGSPARPAVPALKEAQVNDHSGMGRYVVAALKKIDPENAPEEIAE